MPKRRARRPQIAAGFSGPVEVPEELMTRLHPVWQDWEPGGAVEEFCAAYDLDPGPWFGPLTAFRAVVNAYAVKHGRSSGDELGIPMFTCSLESRERRGALYSDLTWTDTQREFLAGAEQRYRDELAGGQRA